jgi:hypothetical protein
MRVNVGRNMCPYLKIMLCVHAVWDLSMSFVSCEAIGVHIVRDILDTHHYTGLLMISWRILQNRYTGMAERTSTYDSHIATLQAYFYLPRTPSLVGGRQGSYTAIQVCRFYELYQGITNNSVLARRHVAWRSPFFQFPGVYSMSFN